MPSSSSNQLAVAVAVAVTVAVTVTLRYQLHLHFYDVSFSCGIFVRPMWDSESRKSFTPGPVVHAGLFDGNMKRATKYQSGKRFFLERLSSSMLC
jgi:hypothetical protein